MLSLNERALAILRHMIGESEALGLEVRRLDNGTTLVDAGVNVPGSLEAGRLFAEVCLAGLGKVRFCETGIGGSSFPAVSVTVGRPLLACMASQYAGWAVKVDGVKPSGAYFAMGSGPARALFLGEPLFSKLEYRDRSESAVLALEGRSLPSEEVAAWIAGKCRIDSSRLYLLVAPTASLAGSVQIAARVVETGLHKMLEVGFDIGSVISGFGTCPVAPVAGDDLRAIGRTNDAVLYGGKAWYTVRGDDRSIEGLVKKMPSSASSDYGTPFYELFQRYGGDFYKIDPMLFSPAEVCINNVATGRSFQVGRAKLDIIGRMFAE
jgi:methenyltetrahydromethanopterin cyclohydrolase